jgi:hypothetical protein
MSTSHVHAVMSCHAVVPGSHASSFTVAVAAVAAAAWGYQSWQAAVDGWYNEVQQYSYAAPGFSGATGGAAVQHRLLLTGSSFGILYEQLLVVCKDAYWDHRLPLWHHVTHVRISCLCQLLPALVCLCCGHVHL